MRLLFVSMFVVSLSLPAFAVTRTCGHDDGVLLRLHFGSSPWTSTGELSGKVVSSWIGDQISIPLKFTKAGGSSMAAWWQSVSVFPNNRLLRTSYWFKEGALRVFLSLEESGAVARRLELGCN